MREQFRPEDLAQFAIAGDADFEGAVGAGAGLRSGGLVTVAAADGARKRKDGGGKPSGKPGSGGKPGGSGGKKQKGGSGAGGDARQKKARR